MKKFIKEEHGGKRRGKGKKLRRGKGRETKQGGIKDMGKETDEI